MYNFIKGLNRQIDLTASMNHEKFMDYKKYVVNSDRAKKIVELIDRDGMKVLDIGGASGLLLDEIINKSGKTVLCTNLEIDKSYINKQRDIETLKNGQPIKIPIEIL